MWLIDANKLWKEINAIGGCDAEKGSWSDGWDQAINACIGLVEDAPTVVHPVKINRSKKL